MAEWQRKDEAKHGRKGRGGSDKSNAGSGQVRLVVAALCQMQVSLRDLRTREDKSGCSVSDDSHQDLPLVLFTSVQFSKHGEVCRATLFLVVPEKIENSGLFGRCFQVATSSHKRSNGSCSRLEALA